MGFEYVYAYLENMQWAFAIATVVMMVLLIILIALRIQNEMDVDDWTQTMIIAIPVFLLLIVFDCAPGMEHIQKVRSEALKPYVKPATVGELILEQEKNETPTFYPSNYCVNSLTCK